MADEQYWQGETQLLQTESEPSPQKPSGQESTQVLELKNLGLVQVVQIEPEPKKK